ncbi:MAG: HlyD family secretion protein, partial [Bacteroidota bacterium]
INEVDIRKVKRGQEVEIGFDAFPDKSLRGRIIKVANVGESRPNSDAKVFEVLVEVFGTDPLLKPGMTTSNRILTNTYEETLFVPLESLHSQYDSITYVFKKDGVSTVKQEVMLGDANAEYVQITGGLTEGDKISLSSVSGLKEEEVELLAEMDGKRWKKEEELPELAPEQPAPKRRWGRKGGK